MDIQRMIVIGRIKMTLGVSLHTFIKLKSMVKNPRVKLFRFAKTILVRLVSIGNISKDDN